MLLPDVNGVRLATLDDLPRIAIVAAAAFFWSPTFRFQRPYYHEFPADTLASYWSEYAQAIEDPACVVLIAEDLLEADEAEHIYKALRSACPLSRPGQKAIVGVCSITLKPGSCYVGHFQPAGREGPINTKSNEDCLERDRCPQATKIYQSVTGPPKSRYLAGRMRLSTIAVFPAYWRRGHATRLVNFCTQLADMDDALLGVSATPHGALVIAKAGFEECEIIRLAQTIAQKGSASDHAPPAASVELWIGLRLPRSRSLSSGNASQSESPE